MNWLLYGTLGILAVGLIVGYIKGALRIAVSLVAVVVTWILIVAIAPYVTDAAMKYTPIDDWIESRCEALLIMNMTNALAEQTGIEESAEIDLSAFSDRLTGVEISRQEQAQIIENSDVPEIFKEYLQENNNKEIYSLIGAESFADYIAKGLTHLIMQILTAIVLFVVISIILKVIICVLDIIAWLPIIGGINRAAGAVLGLAVALVVIWSLFLIFTLFYTTAAGKEIFTQIEKSTILSFLYKNNIILKIITGLRF